MASEKDMQAMYQEVLGRGMDDSGRKYYANMSKEELRGTLRGSKERSKRMEMIGLEGGLAPSSDEFDYVEIKDKSNVQMSELREMYATYLGRELDDSGASSFVGKDYNTIRDSIFGSKEYKSRIGTLLKPSGKGKTDPRRKPLWDPFSQRSDSTWGAVNRGRRQ